MYNKAELTAMQIIASKLNWNKPVWETMETIDKMVRNQQSLDLDCVGECGDFEETLLNLTLWEKDDIISAMYVSSYQDLVMWGVECFCEDMGITQEEFSAMLTWNSVKDNILANLYEEEEEYYQDYYADYYAEMQMEMSYYC